MCGRNMHQLTRQHVASDACRQFRTWRVLVVEAVAKAKEDGDAEAGGRGGGGG